MNLVRVKEWLRRQRPLFYPAKGLWHCTLALQKGFSWARWRIGRLCQRPVQRKHPPAPGDTLHIVIVSHHPSLVRESKLAYAIKHAGHRVTLIMLNVCPRKPDHVDALYTGSNEWQILRILDRLSPTPDVVHMIAPSMGSAALLNVLRHTAAKTVFDAYDCTEGMVRPEFIPDPARAYATERASFEEADHICARSLEPLYLRRELGYRLPPVTYFPEYCWKVPRRREPREVGPEDELHIVYVGGVHPENRYDPKRYSYTQYLEIGRALAKQRLHLHIYPTPNPYRDAIFEDFYSLYIEESQTNRFFHIYRPLPQKELMETLPQYDAALHVLGPTIQSLGRNTEAKLRYSTTNKIFDYLEAGLPIIIHPGFHQHGLARHYGEAIRLRTGLNGLRERLTALLAQPGPILQPTMLSEQQNPRIDAMYRSLLERMKYA